MISGTTVAYFVARNVLEHRLAWLRVNDERATVYEPPVKKVSIVLPAWREPKEFLLTAIKSLRNQNVVKVFPKRFEFILVDGIDYLDEVEHLFDKVIHPDRPGKLAARNDGVRASRGEIIVSVDADTYYPPNWLNMHLSAYGPGVVATTGTTFYGEYEVFVKRVFNWWWAGKMLGRASTFYRWAFEAIGGFREDLPPDDPVTMMSEEEFGFYARLKKFGRVVLVDAPVVHLGVEGDPLVMKAGRGIRSRH